MPRKRRHKLVAIAAVALIVIGIAAACSYTSTEPQTAATTTTQPGIGDPVRDGNFEFVVTRIYEPTKVEGFDKPLGVWVAVDLTVANIKDDQQSFSSTDQILIVTDAEYESSLTLDSDVYLSVNPGLNTDTTVYFDVPEKVHEATTITVELHDSMFSGGIRVVAVPDWAILELAAAEDEPDESPATPTETTATTSESRAATTTEAPLVGESSLDSPIQLGAVVQVGSWRLRVSAITPDGTDEVMEENQFNDPPPEGNQFFIASLEATYTGTESSTFWGDMTLKSVGDSKVAYEGGNASCGVIPDNIRRLWRGFSWRHRHGQCLLEYPINGRRFAGHDRRGVIQLRRRHSRVLVPGQLKVERPPPECDEGLGGLGGVLVRS